MQGVGRPYVQIEAGTVHNLNALPSLKVVYINSRLGFYLGFDSAFKERHYPFHTSTRAAIPLR